MVVNNQKTDEGEFAAYMKSLVSVGRYGLPEEIAGLVSCLSSPEAAYIDGASLDIDGGFVS